MPVVTPLNQSPELLYVRSLNSSGKPVLETRRFRNVKVDATPEAIFQVAAAIAAISLGDFANYQVTTASNLAQA